MERSAVCRGLYTSDYWNKQVELLNIEDKKRQAESQFKYVKKYLPKPSAILDVGSGASSALDRILSLNRHLVTTVDPDKRNNPDICGFIEEYNFDRTYDFAIISHALEHFYDLSVLDRLSKVVDYIFIEVPNCEHDKTLRGSMNENNKSTFHFSMKGLCMLLDRHGFDVLSRDRFRYSMKSGYAKGVEKDSDNNLLRSIARRA